jgi:hypothetical protein
MLFGFDPKAAAPRRLQWVLLLSAILIMSLITALWALDNFPNSADEYAYLFQARTFEAGRLWNRPLPLGQVMGAQYLWVAQGKWVGQYPPAWPAVLAVADRIAPGGWLANIFLTLLAAIGVGHVVTRRAGPEAGWLSVLLFGLSPFTLFNAGSLFSHTLAATLAVAALILWMNARDRVSLFWAVATGCAVGALGLNRSIAAAVLVAALGLDLLLQPRRIRLGLGLMLGGLPFAALLLAYQYSITGDPLKPAYWLGGRDVDHLYFSLSAIKQGLRHNALYLGELSLWAGPPIVALWAIAIVIHVRHRTLTASDLIFPIGVLLFCFYPLHPGNRYGPRYFFDFWPFFVVSLCSALPILNERFRPAWRQSLRFCVVWGAVLWAPLSFEFRWLIHDREELYHQVAQHHLSNAIVCVESSSGHYMPMPRNDLARNDVDGRNSILYARCPGMSPSKVEKDPLAEFNKPSPSEYVVASPDEVTAAYPQRSVWIFRPTASTLDHELVRFK